MRGLSAIKPAKVAPILERNQEFIDLGCGLPAWRRLSCGRSGQGRPWLTVTRRREQVVICRVSCYNIRIVIKHKGLRAFFERGDARRLHVALAPRIRRILSDLDAALLPGDMDIPGYRLHPLTGDRRDQWSVRVSGNWRIVFRFMDGVATDVDLIDYH